LVRARAAGLEGAWSPADLARPRQLVVPADSPITDIAQLKGLEVAFPGPEALVAYKMPYAQLLARNVDVRVVFGGNQDGALAQLFSGKVAAAGGNSQLLEGYAKRTGKAFRILWSSGPLHDLALMASPRVPEKDMKAVAAAFIGMGRIRSKDILHARRRQSASSPDACVHRLRRQQYGAYRAFYQTAPVSLR
jgi:phosphonate transport system substrate-binding protein